jgi:hypothetical protein
MFVCTASSRCWVRLAAEITTCERRARSAASCWRSIASTSIPITAATTPTIRIETQIVRAVSRRVMRSARRRAGRRI